MHRKKTRQPGYLLHKPTGQAYVRIHGRALYLGLYDSPESHRKYASFIADYLAGYPVEEFSLRKQTRALTVGELVSLFGHGSFLQGTAFAVISQSAQGVWNIESTSNLPSTGTVDHDKPPETRANRVIQPRCRVSRMGRTWHRVPGRPAGAAGDRAALVGALAWLRAGRVEQ